MTQSKQTKLAIGWQPYELDKYAERLVRKYRDKKNVLNESHKMRMSVAYGLERFWGEHIRLKAEKKIEDKDKGEYWLDVWKALGEILDYAGIKLPGQSSSGLTTDEIKQVTEYLWCQLTLEDRRVALMVLTQLCNALVWWTQRYKIRER
jgi:hypothetical protein